MKKLLLFALLFSFLAAGAQLRSDRFRAMSQKSPQGINNENSSYKSEWNAEKIPPASKIPASELRDYEIVNPIAIGQSGNAFGFAFNRTTNLWADDNINAVTFMHRMVTTPGTGYLAYDISKDGGQSWENNVMTYNPTLPDGFDARYPQGAIFNPAGNTDPDNAYFHYFAPTLDGSNTGSGTNWGGYAWGVKQLADGSTQTQHNQTSVPPYYQYLPAAFTITQTGEAWMVDDSELGATSGYTYQGNLIVGRGIWITELSDFEYSFDLFPLAVNSADGINDIKIAFSPDGMTGYICVMTNLPATLPYTSYHPVLFKTTDGGESWSEPIEVQLGGENGLEPVRQFISDSMLTLYFDPEPVPPRDEIDYYMGYDCDLSVDAWGNPHIAGMICIADNAEGVIYAGEGLMAMFHIWSDDQGQTWNAFNLYDLKRFRADFGPTSTGISMFNRPQVATTMDGAIVFFSWLDTESPEIEDNSAPDLYFREYLPSLGEHGEAAVNVTFLSAGMWSAYFGCMSHYVLSEVSETDYTCTIPFVYESMTGLDPQLPVQFYYIPDFVRSYTLTGIKDRLPASSVTVAQNYPNPFTTTTSIRVSLLQESHVKLEIYDLTGNLVNAQDFGKLSNGIHDLDLNASGMSSGVYFYAVNAGSDRVIKKMVVQ